MIQIAKDEYAIIMKEAFGKTLLELLKSDEINTADRYQIALNIAKELKKMHDKGILHLDLKLDQIMINANGEVKKISISTYQTIASSWGEEAKYHWEVTRWSSGEEWIIVCPHNN